MRNNVTIGKKSEFYVDTTHRLAAIIGCYDIDKNKSFISNINSGKYPLIGYERTIMPSDLYRYYFESEESRTKWIMMN